MMNGRHLPAGQGMQNDMNRRRPYGQQPYQPATPIYNGYYGAPYYPQMPPPYQHMGIPQPPYPLYNTYGRSPPPQVQHYSQTPPPIVSSYTQPQQSPAIVSTPYQPPPPQTPSSTQSTHTVTDPPTPSTTSQLSMNIPQVESPPQRHFTYQPPLPWYSRPDLDWPTKSARSRRRRKLAQSSEPVELPTLQLAPGQKTQPESTEPTTSTAARPETPSTSLPPSEAAPSTTPTTPSSLPATVNAQVAAKATQRPVAAIPVVPILPKTATRPQQNMVAPESASQSEALPAQPTDATAEVKEDGEQLRAEVDEKTSAQAVSGGPKLWTGLFKGASISSSAVTNGGSAGAAPTFGSMTKSNGETVSDVLYSFNATMHDGKIPFIEPRGLVNTGNMCYMNSVLQVLVFCVPFYDFLDQVAKKAAHSFKSDTPLIDAMIMFMREYRVIDSASSVEQLRMRLKDAELEQYGEAFTPEFVYDVIKRLPLFSTMQRGHQQDAEEFLGFLLEELHVECVRVMQSNVSNQSSAMATPSNVPSSPTSDVASLAGAVPDDAANGWMEVGPKQRAAVTRSSGTRMSSPVTKIFGGSLRSELRVPGLKNSVTIEPYQPLQLDIGSPQINNIIDALKGLTRSETLHGDFNSPRGPNVTATKQVFIESLPPVLILHLKRFQYNSSTGGTQKIWKKVGYPLELEIPKEAFSRQKQASIMNHGGLPKYRLIAVVYHHGKNASGGHYTVDVRRQDGREWIRLDDTVIRRVRSDEVAEGGSEEDPKVLAAALEAHKADTISTNNIFAGMKMYDDEESENEDEWKQVNGSATSSGANKKWSSVVNGATTPKAKNGKFSIKDNKVAYLLFYQRIDI